MKYNCQKSSFTTHHLISYAKMYTNFIDFKEQGKVDPQEPKLLALQAQLTSTRKKINVQVLSFLILLPLKNKPSRA